MRYFLGIDTGGTKSHALIVDESGCAVGFGEGGKGNPHFIGYAAFSKLLYAITRQALTEAGIGPQQIAGVGMGVGGYDWPSEREITLGALAPIGLDAPAEVVNDSALGIWAGTDDAWGIAIESGTGCNCRGRDRLGREGRMVGYGYPVGEGAGAVELTIKALQAVALEWTRRGPATRLSQALAEFSGAATVREFLERATTTHLEDLYQGTAAPLIFKVAAEGDPVAQELVSWAGHELGSMVCGVVRQLELEKQEFPVVMLGSMFNGSPLLADKMQEMVHQVAPGARLTRLTAPPVVGAPILAMEQAGLDPRGIRHRIIKSFEELRARDRVQP